ncbi:WxL protein peptidoglycan domain-containing protein [Actinoplanes sp. CA-142083]|uniref:WxL protein peptidoglycan domain-containing protein n=1 Tax=Actinoplanes sp. CA-142083 TaxID=3239903 RepID=UPI003D931E04
MRRATAATALLGVLLGLVSGAPAEAAPGDSNGGGRATFGLRPTGKNGPDDRPTFAYGATPGGVFNDQVEISNAGTKPLTLKVYASDAFTPRTGGFDLLAAGGKSDDAGSWVSVSRPSVTVPARGRIILPFTLKVPAGATPGDHAAGIVASLTSIGNDAKGNKVAVDQRVGARIYLRVSGALEARLAVEGLTAKYHPKANPFSSGTTTVTYRVRNTGNVRLGAHQKVTVKSFLGGKKTADAIADVPEILPGDAVDMTAEVKGAFPAIWLTGSVTADPLAQKIDQELPVYAVKRDHGFWAVSWTLLAIAGGILLIAGAFFGTRYLRRRRAKGVAGATA